MHQKIALCAGVLVLSFPASAPVSAQPVPPYYPGAANPGVGPALPPHEILASVRSMGLEPLTRPLRHGPAYALRAADPAGHEVRVIADARTGRILQVVRVPAQLNAAPYGRPPGRIADVPDGYGPNSRVGAVPPSPPGPAAGGLPAVQAPTAVPPRATAQAGPPPLPRPRPKLAAADSTAAPPAISAAPQAPPSAPTETKPAETTGAIAPTAASTTPVEEAE